MTTIRQSVLLGILLTLSACSVTFAQQGTVAVTTLTPTPNHSEMVLTSVESMHVDVEQLASLLSSLTSYTVVPDANTNQLFMNLPASAKDEVLALIQRIDQPRRRVSIAVTELVTTDKKLKLSSGPSEPLQKSIQDAIAANRMTQIDEKHLLTFDNAEGSIQVGATVPMESGRTTSRRPGTPSQKQYQYSETGSIFSATPRIRGENVNLRFLFERSEVVVQQGEPSPEEFVPHEIVTTKASSDVSIGPGESIVIEGLRRSENGPIRWFLVITTEIQ